MEQPQEVRRGRGPSVVGPLILIGLGVLFLLNTMGVLPWGVWATLWRLWPVVLILIGVDLLFGRSYPWLSAAVAVLAIGGGIALLVLAGPVLGLDGGWSWGGPTGGPRIEQQVSVPRDNAQQASLNIQFGAGRLSIDPLAAGSAAVIEGDLSHNRGENGVQTRIDRQGDRVTVTLAGREGTFRFPGDGSQSEVWNLRLNEDVPFNLRVEGGAAEANLNLRELVVRDLNVDMGASSVRIELPAAAGESRARIKAGAADVRVTVPEGVAARIATEGGLASISVNESRFPQQGEDLYMSPDYSSALNKVDISIDAGASSVRVE